jgi:hypothetical protein
MVVATHYGALELGGHRRMTRTKARVMYAVAAACVASVCMIAVAVSTSSPTGEQPSVLIGEGMDDMDVSYLSAEARGKDGDSLLKRLQEVWFVGAHKDGLQDVSAQANSLATQLMSAEVYSEPDDAFTHSSRDIASNFHAATCLYLHRGSPHTPPPTPLPPASSEENSHLSPCHRAPDIPIPSPSPLRCGSFPQT